MNAGQESGPPGDPSAFRQTLRFLRWLTRGWLPGRTGSGAGLFIRVLVLWHLTVLALTPLYLANGWLRTAHLTVTNDGPVPVRVLPVIHQAYVWQYTSDYLWPWHPLADGTLIEPGGRLAIRYSLTDADFARLLVLSGDTPRALAIPATDALPAFQRATISLSPANSGEPLDDDLREGLARLPQMSGWSQAEWILFFWYPFTGVFVAIGDLMLRLLFRTLVWFGLGA